MSFTAKTAAGRRSAARSSVRSSTRKGTPAFRIRARKRAARSRDHDMPGVSEKKAASVGFDAISSSAARSAIAAASERTVGIPRGAGNSVSR